MFLFIVFTFSINYIFGDDIKNMTYKQGCVQMQMHLHLHLQMPHLHLHLNVFGIFSAHLHLHLHLSKNICICICIFEIENICICICIWVKTFAFFKCFTQMSAISYVMISQTCILKVFSFINHWIMIFK